MKSIICKVCSLLCITATSSQWEAFFFIVSKISLKPIPAQADKILGLRNLQPVFDC